MNLIIINFVANMFFKRGINMKKILIIGLGMIGGSLAGAIKKYTVKNKIYGMDKNKDAENYALENNLIDFQIKEIKDVEKMDIIFIATPTMTFEVILNSIKNNLNKNVIITDVCSSKQHTVNVVKNVFNDLDERFIPGHPIAGKEKSSIKYSDSNLFIGKKWVLTPTGKESEKNFAELKTLLSLIGAKTKIMTIAEHDKMFALTSHLPHFLAFSILNEIKNSRDYEELKDNSSSGFEDFVRIGGANPRMWTDIALSNQDELIEKIEDFMDELKDVTKWIRQRDEENILKFIENSNQVYKDIKKES